MIIDGHVKFRFVQRIMGIVNENEINKFIANNEFEVIYRINEFINNAEVLIEGYAPSRKDTLDYYINNETLIVMKPNKAEIVTLFDITLDADSKQNTEKIKQYVKTIRKNNHLINELKIKQKKQDSISKHYEFMIEYLTGTIGEDVMSKIKMDKDHSVSVCIDYAAQCKALRMENRELMSQMFIKLDLK
jgi:hypothetical protein